MCLRRAASTARQVEANEQTTKQVIKRRWYTDRLDEVAGEILSEPRVPSLALGVFVRRVAEAARLPRYMFRTSRVFSCVVYSREPGEMEVAVAPDRVYPSCRGRGCARGSQIQKKERPRDRHSISV